MVQIFSRLSIIVMYELKNWFFQSRYVETEEVI